MLGAPSRSPGPFSRAKDEERKALEKEEWHSPVYSLAGLSNSGAPLLKPFHLWEEEGHLRLCEPHRVPTEIAASCLPPESWPRRRVFEQTGSRGQGGEECNCHTAHSGQTPARVPASPWLCCAHPPAASVSFLSSEVTDSTLPSAKAANNPDIVERARPV